MGDFDRNFNRRGSSRGRFDRPSGRGRSGGRDRGGDRGGFGGRDRERSGGFDGRDRRTERREMHPAVCDKCGNDCEVPFRPTEGKPIYCDDCFKDKSVEAGSRSEIGKPNNLDQINNKLDKILRLLEGKKESVKEKPKKEEQPEVKEPKNLGKDIEKELPDLEEPKKIEKPKKKRAKKKK